MWGSGPSSGLRCDGGLLYAIVATPRVGLYSRADSVCGQGEHPWVPIGCEVASATSSERSKLVLDPVRVRVVVVRMRHHAVRGQSAVIGAVGLDCGAGERK
jgi:hypothetical protein